MAETAARYRLEAQVASAKTIQTLYPLSVNHTIAITDDQQGIAIALAEKLKAQRYSVEIVSDVLEHSDVVILLEGLKVFPNHDEAIAANRLAFRNVCRIAKRFMEKGGILFTVQNTGGQFGLTPFDELNAWGAGLSGLVKTAATEWPKAFCKVIDVEAKGLTAEAIAERIFQEIINGDAEKECGILANNERIILKTVPTKLRKKPHLTWCDHLTMVVSGGGRGITAACLLELAKKTKGTFILLGRTKLETIPEQYQHKNEAQLIEILFAEAKSNNAAVTPNQIRQNAKKIQAIQEIQRNLELLKAAGSKADYFCVDIQDGEKLTQTLSEVRKKFGSINAILHGAGVLEDKFIADLTEEQFSRVFNTKVIGLRNLLQATANDPIQFLGLFSSVTARFGNAGQSAYAMANEVLNKVAQYEQRCRGEGCLVKSFNWGPWEGGMVTAQLKEAFSKRGVALLPEAIGTKMFLEELYDTAKNDVEIVCGGVLNSPKKREETFLADPTSHSFLNSHIINGQPVLPACLVLDWFLRLSGHQSIQNFSVLKGIRLSSPEAFNVSYEEGHYQLQNNKGQRCYVAEDASFENSAINFNTPTHPWKQKNIYHSRAREGILFHGPALQVISKLETISEEGGSAKLKGLYALNWSKENWALDVAAVDGVLQLLLLWRFYWSQEKTLPTKIGNFILFSKELPNSEMTCVFRCHKRDGYRFLADAVLLQKDNKPYAKLENVEMCVANI